jgi:hypothetical protein
MFRVNPPCILARLVSFGRSVFLGFYFLPHTERTVTDKVWEMCVQGPRMVRDVFRLAKENAPAIIFIDEVDAIATARFDAQTGADRCALCQHPPPCAGNFLMSRPFCLA